MMSMKNQLTIKIKMRRKFIKVKPIETQLVKTDKGYIIVIDKDKSKEFIAQTYDVHNPKIKMVNYFDKLNKIAKRVIGSTYHPEVFKINFNGFENEIGKSAVQKVELECGTVTEYRGNVFKKAYAVFAIGNDDLTITKLL